MKSLLLLVCIVGLVSAEAEAEADPACNNCGQRPPYIKGARVRSLRLRKKILKQFDFDLIYSTQFINTNIQNTNNTQHHTSVQVSLGI